MLQCFGWYVFILSLIYYVLLILLFVINCYSIYRQRLCPELINIVIIIVIIWPMMLNLRGLIYCQSLLLNTLILI